MKNFVILIVNLVVLITLVIIVLYNYTTVPSPQSYVDKLLIVSQHCSDEKAWDAWVGSFTRNHDKLQAMSMCAAYQTGRRDEASANKKAVLESSHSARR